jgi:hypothetical protein
MALLFLDSFDHYATADLLAPRGHPGLMDGNVITTAAATAWRLSLLSVDL